MGCGGVMRRSADTGRAVPVDAATRLARSVIQGNQTSTTKISMQPAGGLKAADMGLHLCALA